MKSLPKVQFTIIVTRTKTVVLGTRWGIVAEDVSFILFPHTRDLWGVIAPRSALFG